MKFKIGDKVRVKDINWYNKNKNKFEEVENGNKPFVKQMSKYCGDILTIIKIDDNSYYCKEDDQFWCWCDCMLEDEKFN